MQDMSIGESLAQPKPCRARPTEEQAYEKDEKGYESGVLKVKMEIPTHWFERDG